MAFIKQTEREQLIKNVNRSYAVKKVLLLVDIVALITFVVMTFVSFFLESTAKDLSWFDASGALTGLGWGMLVLAAATVVLGVVCVVLVFTIRSPKGIKKDIKKLESSALSGVKIKKGQTAGEIMKSRRTPEKAKEKAKK